MQCHQQSLRKLRWKSFELTSTVFVLSSCILCSRQSLHCRLPNVNPFNHRRFLHPTSDLLINLSLTTSQVTPLIRHLSHRCESIVVVVCCICHQCCQHCLSPYLPLNCRLHHCLSRLSVSTVPLRSVANYDQYLSPLLSNCLSLLSVTPICHRGCHHC